MNGYKGFDKDLKCRDFQYEVGKTYKEDKAEMCTCGFHFCENPFDVFNYYNPANSRYGTVSTKSKVLSSDDDSKNYLMLVRYARFGDNIQHTPDIGRHCLSQNAP